MADERRKRFRCAIYTRKSTEDGLEQEFNSLDAQREACVAYITSQRHEGWEQLPDFYDDGGFSGGTMERPGLKQLLVEVEAGRVDIIVVYKVDRLTRSLSDFARIVDVLDRKGASFVSVTQSFNTTNSMGRLTLNVLLSFAQFEREVTGERIRDKIAASKAKGMWMGGPTPLGYDAKDRTLVINETEAVVIRHIFERYTRLGSIGALIDELAVDGYRTKARMYRDGRIVGGIPFGKGMLAALIKNRIYVGDIVHRGKCYPGLHPAIIDPELFDRVQAMMASNRRDYLAGARSLEPSLLTGMLIDPSSRPMTPVHTAKGSRRYRYYVSRRSPGEPENDLIRIPAGPIEKQIIAMLDRRERFNALADGRSVDAPPGCKVGYRRMLLALEATIQLSTDRVTLSVKDANSDNQFVVLEEKASLIGTGPSFKRSIPPACNGITGDADPSLIRLLVHSFAARRSKVEGLREPLLANYSENHLAKLVRLSWLAPDIVDAILGGRQPGGLTGRRLLRVGNLPIDWSGQRSALGFA